MHKRIVFLYCAMVTLAMALILRVWQLSFSEDLTQAATSQSSYSVEICRTRGAIYDCNGQRMTETQSHVVAAISPSAEAMQTVATNLKGSQRSAVLQLLREGKPFLCDLGRQRLYGEGIRCFDVYERYASEPLAPHLIGYLDGSGIGVSGLEQAFEQELRAAGEQVVLRYGVDIQQKPLESVTAEQSGSAEPPKAGLVLTLDKDIQQLCQVIGRQMLDKGAIVVMDVDSGQLKAVVSLPTFDPNDLTAALNDEEKPFFNRAFAAYNVGSSFKLAVAAAALEQGISPDFSVNCVGGVEIAGRMIYCHHRAGHGETDMERALEQSCNPYFIALGQEIGDESILTMAEHMGFGRGSDFAEGLSASAGNLPKAAASPLELANLSFGQGELLATPLQIAAMVSSIANGGYQVEAQLLLGWTEDGSVPQAAEQAKERILTERTAKRLQHDMIQVVEEGSGTNAKPSAGGAGGKTASAQTGRYTEEEEIVHAWFAGFYPADEPRYSIVVLAEGMESGGTYAAPVFRRICEQITVLEQERQ